MISVGEILHDRHEEDSVTVKGVYNITLMSRKNFETCRGGKRSTRGHRE